MKYHSRVWLDRVTATVLSASVVWVIVIVSSVTIASAEPVTTNPPNSTLAVVVGLVTQSEYHQGPVRFSNGDVDFVSVDPDSSLHLGLSFSYLLTDRLAGHIGLGFGKVDASYIEQDRLRPDVEISTLTLDLGVNYLFVSTPKVRVGGGGGLSLGFQSIDNMTWDGVRIDPSTSVLGLHGVGIVDVPLSARLAFRALLRVGLSSPRLGGFEDELARAEREAGATADTELRTDAMLAVGLAVGL